MEVLGEIVDDLRSRRAAGEPISRFVREMRGRGWGDLTIEAHLREAYHLVGPEHGLYFIARDADRNFIDAEVDKRLCPAVDETASKWRGSAPYPDLLSRGDRLAFKEVAARWDLILIVCVPDPSVRRYARRPGFRPAPPQLDGFVRVSPPNEGLLAVDPSEPELSGGAGWTVADELDGHILRDASGTAFYPGYLLHGVYSFGSRRNAWTPEDGEAIRAELNARMGEELVQTGPYDTWQHAARPEAPVRAPRPPVFFFLPDGSVEFRESLDAMRSYYLFLRIDWDRLYPQHGASLSEGAA